MKEKNKHTHPIVKKIVRLKIALLLISLLAIFALIYVYSSESQQPFIGYPKELNHHLLDQEIDNAKLQFLVDSLRKVNEILMKETEKIDEGIFFEVQIGDFENFRTDKHNQNLKKLDYSTIDGINYITLGKFRDIDDAKLFIEDIKKIGIEDAFIVSKLDGERVTIRE